MQKINGVGFTRIVNATLCSIKGLKAAYRDEPAFRQEVLLAVILFPISFVLANSFDDWLPLFGSLLFLLFAEIVNSAIEALADRISFEHHALIGKAKDLGSAAVFIAILYLIVVWSHSIYNYLMLYVAT